MSSLEVSTHQDGEASIISLDGDLDMTSAPTLLAAANVEINSSSCTAVVLDAAGLQFLDSSGLGCFVELHNTAIRQGKTLRIDNLPDAARRIVNLGGLSTLIDPDAR